MSLVRIQVGALLQALQPASFFGIIIVLMKRLFFILPILLSFVFGYLFSTHFVYSDELDDITKKMNELQNALDMSKKATAPLESQLSSLQTQLKGIESQVAFITQDVSEKKKIIDESYVKLAEEKDTFNKAVRSNYIKNYSYNPLVIFLSSTDAASVTTLLTYQKRSADRDKALITNMALKITDLEERKRKLEEEEKRLVVVKVKLASERADIEKVVLGAKAYQSTLSKQIAELSAKQQALIAAKQASLNLPRSASIASGCTDDRDVDPGFSPRFAVFTYGIPHRVGMSQWGAYGRAKAGQDYKTILSAYFNNVKYECRDFGRIKVQGYGEISITDYLKGLGEMPESWGGNGGYEALKAQVVAAASYAYVYTNKGSGEICTSQECQVYIGRTKGGKWDQAVDEVKGKCGGDGVEMIVSNDTNDVIKAWYASTFGGYTFTSADVFGGSTPWTKRSQDTSSALGGGDSFSQLNERAYDKQSPYFYCDWGSRSQYNKTAWLKENELVDIVNVISLAKRDSSTISHLSQVDKSNPDGVETWDEQRVKSELSSRGGTALNSISDIGIDWDRNVGTVSTVRISGDGGSVSFDGSEFRNFFNVRAPSNIQIVGPLYNIERR